MRHPLLAQAFRIYGTQAAWARALGVSTATVATWRNVPARHLQTVASMLQVPPDALLPPPSERGRRRLSARMAEICGPDHASGDNLVLTKSGKRTCRRCAVRYSRTYEQTRRLRCRPAETADA